MLFSSTAFLFGFLPAVSVLYLISGREMRSYVLLLASLLFYAWGEPKHLPVLLCVCLESYLAALLLGRLHHALQKKLCLGLFILADLAALIYYKYSNFILENLRSVFSAGPEPEHVLMPIGISFFTFQAISYVIDVYRGTVSPQQNIVKLMLYISFFPQLIAGPIVQYHDIEEDLRRMESSFDDVVCGLKRFTEGLGKKVLIANPLGAVADHIFGLGYQNLDMGLAWLGAVAYSLQLFFDFSGYSDMAIGLGQVFGFRFRENFNHPYISKSITEFWRRWHISLGTWFKEYVYIPLGGNRGGGLRTYFNLLFVFLLTGIWHGANWTFFVWGLWNGLFIVLERRLGIKTVRDDAYGTLRHIYALLVIVTGWTIFRAESLTEGIGYLGTMFGVFSGEYIPFSAGYYMTGLNLLTLCLAVLLSCPVGTLWESRGILIPARYCAAVRSAFLLLVLLLSVSSLAGSTYNPFIYFRF